MADVFTSAGEYYVVDLLDTTGTSYIGWGTGSTAAAKGDTALGTEASEARVAATRSQPSADQIRYVATITANGTKTITEAGAFDAITSGTMLVRSVFTGIQVVSGDTVEFTVTVEFT